MKNKFLAEISRSFFYQQQVFRYKMKKVSEISNEEVIKSCHHYCEDNNLIDEWNQFRNKRENEYHYCSYYQEYIATGLCYDMQMIACGYIKSNALPDMDIDQENLLKYCKDCVHGL